MKKQNTNSSEESRDRLSDLPEFLIHHILSFLPTKDSIRTGLLSKEWKNEWRQVPALIFYYSNNKDSSLNDLKLIDSVLNQWESSKVEKFHISTDLCEGHNLDLDHKIRFAIRRDVEDLILEFNYVYFVWEYVRLPDFLFSHTLLVKLHLCGCNLPKLNDKVNLKHLMEFSAKNCGFPDTTIGNILSGSPSLESLYLRSSKIDRLVIASNSLRKLVLVVLTGSYIGISCPNLKELRFMFLYDYVNTSDDKINTVSDSVRVTARGEFVINSESLKKLVLKHLKIYDLEISCPMLKELELLSGLYIKAAKVVNLPSVFYAALNFHKKCVSKEILLQLQHIKELTFGRTFIESISHSQGKAIEDVVAARFFSGSLSNLKIAQIRGLSEIDDCCRNVIDYVEFLLKNARVLEKLTIFIEDRSKDFVSEVSQKLLSIPLCSQHAKVELWCLDRQLWVEEVKSMDSIEVNRPRGKIVNPIEVIKLIG